MNSKSIQMLAIVTAVVMVSAVVGFAANQIAEARQYASANGGSANGGSANGGKGVGIGGDAKANGGDGGNATEW